MQNPRIEELARRDPRYAPEAYEFVYEALSYAARRLSRAGDAGGGAGRRGRRTRLRGGVPGRRPRAGLARFRPDGAGGVPRWGVRRTDDFGDIVFHLIAAGLMDPTAADDRAAFRDRFDLQNGLVDGYRIEAGDGLEEPS